VGVFGDTTVPLPLRLLNISPLHRSGDKPQASAEVFVTRALLVPANPKKRTSTPYMPSPTAAALTSGSRAAAAASGVPVSSIHVVVVPLTEAL